MSKMIQLEQADRPSLMAKANELGLEIKHGTNDTSIRAAILAADPGCTEIPQIGDPDGQVQTLESAAMAKHGRSSKGNANPRHYSNDPRVRLMIHTTADKSRAKVVYLTVMGDTFAIKRGVEIEVPYRVYRALDLAVEKQRVDTGETNPQTGLPLYDFLEVHSYPHSVKRLPPQSEVDAWLAKTANLTPSLGAKAA